LPIKKELYDKIIENQTLFYDTTDNLRVVVFLLEKTNDYKYIVQASTKFETGNETIKRLKLTLIVLNPIILFLSLIAGILFIKNALKPVAKIVKNVQDIEAKDLSKRIDRINSDDEIDNLIITFNNMLSRLESGFKNIKRFSQNVSHELITPLTIIRGEIEVGLRKKRKHNEYEKILNQALIETKTLQKSIDNLLFLYSFDKNEIKKSFKEFYLDELVTEIFLEKQKLSKTRSIILSLININQSQ